MWRSFYQTVLSAKSFCTYICSLETTSRRHSEKTWLLLRTRTYIITCTSCSFLEISFTIHLQNCQSFYPRYFPSPPFSSRYSCTTFSISPFATKLHPPFSLSCTLFLFSYSSARQIICNSSSLSIPVILVK